ncbi:MAG: type II toxin-antitoxin system HipA family toxin [Thermodesulfobacteriota bacterium]
MIIKLNVWLTLPTGEIIKTGELAVKDPDARGALAGQFRYSREYLEDPRAFPLDPLHLPLVAGSGDADRPQAGVHGVFEDSLPDDWGRKLMARRYRLGRAEQRVPHLLRLLGGQGMGALLYAERGKSPPSSAGVSRRHLAELAHQAEKFEQAPAAMADEELAMLFQAGSSAGGARPKALVIDEKGAYLAKFASSRDQLDVVSLEAAAMELARRAGIDTAETSLLTLGACRCLLVKRFDINAAGGRNHLISMQSLLKADGYYNACYRDLAEVIRHVSTTPQRDLRMLYRQMVFNVMIGNTDDHLKNFCMLHDDEGWRLSPAFDLIPNIGFNQEHVLRIGLDNRPPDLGTILAEARHFGIKRRQQALDIAIKVYEVVAERDAVFTACEVPEKDAETVGMDIKQRMRKIAPE